MMPTHVFTEGRFTCVASLVNEYVDCSGVRFTGDGLLDLFLPRIEVDDEVFTDVGTSVSVRSTDSGIGFEYVGLESSDTWS